MPVPVAWLGESGLEKIREDDDCYPVLLATRSLSPISCFLPFSLEFLLRLVDYGPSS